mgnify:CR=1 FL=1
MLLDVRSEQAFAEGHIDQAVSLPHQKITAQALQAYPQDTLFVEYNATEKASIRLAALQRPLKKMIGGVCGWLDEGFELVKG